MMLLISILINILVTCALLYLALKRYRPMHGGQIVIYTQADGKKIFSLELDRDPSEIEEAESITFKVTGEKSA